MRRMLAVAALAFTLGGTSQAGQLTGTPPVTLRAGPEYDAMHAEGWIALESRPGVVRLSVAGIPGASVQYGGVLRLVNAGEKAQLVSMHAEASGTKLEWSFAGDGIDWRLANQSSSPPVLLAPYAEVVLDLILSWSDVNAPAEPLHLWVVSRPAGNEGRT